MMVLPSIKPPHIEVTLKSRPSLAYIDLDMNEEEAFIYFNKVVDQFIDSKSNIIFLPYAVYSKLEISGIKLVLKWKKLMKKERININNLVVTCIECQDIFIASNGHLVECTHVDNGHSIRVPLCENCGEVYKQDPIKVNNKLILIFNVVKDELESMGKED